MKKTPQHDIKNTPSCQKGSTDLTVRRLVSSIAMLSPGDHIWWCLLRKGRCMCVFLILCDAWMSQSERVAGCCPCERWLMSVFFTSLGGWIELWGGICLGVGLFAGQGRRGLIEYGVLFTSIKCNCWQSWKHEQQTQRKLTTGRCIILWSVFTFLLKQYEQKHCN